MYTFALLVVLAAQAPEAQAPPAAAPAAAEKTVEQTASPELVGQLVKDLAITPSQAQAGAGTLFGVAKGKLSAADFAKVAAAVPNIDGLLAAAPGPAAVAGAAGSNAAGANAALAALTGKTSAVASMATAAMTLSKLGLKPDQVAKFAPALVGLVQKKGGADVGTLLAGALK